MIRVHVLRASIDQNKKSGMQLPTISVTDAEGRVFLGDDIELLGPVRIRTDLAQDTAVWAETESLFTLRYKDLIVLSSVPQTQP